MPYLFSGIGTKYLGSRAEGSDGSYITTEWVVLFHLPLVPIGSFRVRFLSSGFIHSKYETRRVPVQWPQIRGIYVKELPLLALVAGGYLLFLKSGSLFAPSNMAALPNKGNTNLPISELPPIVYTDNTRKVTPEPKPVSENLVGDTKKLATPKAIPSYVRPTVADNGQPFPTVSGYIPKYPKKATNGLSSLTIKNDGNDSDVFVKVFSRATGRPVRVFFVRAHESFTAKEITPGKYDVRYRDLDSGGFAKTDEFEFAETKDSEGTNYKNMVMTLYKVANGNMHTEDISAESFE
jgi:hypothetical protein